MSIIRKAPELISRDGVKKCSYCGVELTYSGGEFRATKVNTVYGLLRRQLNNGKAYGLVDHIIPKSKGGSNKIHNLAQCCFECNCLKGDRSIEWLVDRLQQQADSLKEEI